MTIDRVHEHASKLAVTGWFVALIWFWLRDPFAEQMHWWGWPLLIFAGPFIASIAIGGGTALTMGILTRIFYGRADASTDLYAWGAFVGAVFAFLALSPIARLIG